MKLRNCGERQVLLCRPGAQQGDYRAVSALAAGGDRLLRDSRFILQGDDGGARSARARRTRSQAGDQRLPGMDQAVVVPAAQQKA